MAELKFEIAKKLQKPQKGSPGLTLRSFRFSCAESAAQSAPDAPANQIIVLADEYGLIREQVRNTTGIHCRSMGRSLRIASDDAAALAEFAKELPFNSEEALDVFEYLAPALRSDSYAIVSAELDPGSMSLRCSKQIKGCTKEDGSEGEKPEPEASEAFFSELSSQLEKYEMGVIKQPD